MNSTTQLQIRPLKPNIKLTAYMKGKHVSTSASSKGPNFNELLLETVDATFSTLGDSSKEALYRYLEKRNGVKREDIPGNIATFAHALEEIFGQSALLLEARIMQTLHSKVPDFKYLPKEELAFAEYIENLRAFLQRPPQF
jgi:hypothetical protein